MTQIQELQAKLETMLESTFIVNVVWKENEGCYRAFIQNDHHNTKQIHEIDFQKESLDDWKIDYNTDGEYVDFDEASLWRFLYWDVV